MSVLNKIAFYQNRRDEVPNQELARELAAAKNQAGVREIAEALWNEEQNVQSDCLKVLYEIGYLDPSLIADYAEDFIKLLKSRNNRMVWGAMIGLSTIADLKAEVIFPHVDEIKKTMAAGSVITNDAGIRTLAGVASRKDEYRARITPYLLERFASSRTVDAPRYAEFILAAVGPAEKTEFIQILEKWISGASGQRQTRLKKVLKAAQPL
jgi:hypothetical protein